MFQSQHRMNSNKNINFYDENTKNQYFRKCKITNASFTCIIIKYSDIYFIDDNINHLIPLEKLGVNCFLSKWGYFFPENPPKSIVIARSTSLSAHQMAGSNITAFLFFCIAAFCLVCTHTTQ